MNMHEPEELSQEEEINQAPTITQLIIGWLWFFFKLGFMATVILIIVVTGAVIGLLKGFSERIPIVSDRSYRPNLTTQLFDIKGRHLAYLHAEENRTRILASSEIPQNMKHAIIAIEDERFYQHYGIDIVGISRAALKNLQAGRVVQGASTLTQQLVKNAFLTSEKTFKRKAIEAMMAFQIERKYSKEEILTLYLNEIYFGHGAYGLDAAAKIYFDKEPEDLTLIECASLAGIPKSPVAFSPYSYPENNKQRREVILAKMTELGFISPGDYEEAKAQTPVFAKLKSVTPQAPYFVTYVRDALLDKYGPELVYKGGLKVFTTIDLEFQQYAEDAMNDSEAFKKRPIEKFPQMNGSLICLDPKNGHIKAMYGGRSFEQSQFNRVTQALRQPGSSFKPFVYAAALENGALPGDFVVDEYISYTNPWSKKVWAPKNYDLKFHGSITLMKALCNSYNVPAVKLIDKLTPAKVIRTARKLGVTAQMEPNLSLALGSGNFTPLEMASAYGIFANQGIYAPPIAILRVEDRDGNNLEEALPRVKEVMNPVHAAMITDMLRIAVEKGTGRRAAIKGRAVAGKTGTTNDYIDAWFNGFTPELVTIVQFGYDMPKSLGPQQAGGSVAGPVWKAFMEKVLERYPQSDFPVPEGAVRARLCMASGKLASKSCPYSWVVNQIYPVESLPTSECSIHKSGAAYAATEEPMEYAAGPANETVNFEPDPDFFQMDYRNTQTDATRQTSTLMSAPPAGISFGKPPQQGWNKISTTQSAEELDDSLADAPAVDESREPGVVMTPNVEFRDSFY